MATATLLPQARSVFFDANGNPLAGGKVNTFIPSTTTPKVTWQDAAEATPNSNPITLDSAGSWPIYGSGSYQLTVTDALGVAVPGYSGVTSDNAPLATTLAYTPPFTGGGATTVAAKLGQFITATDFGAAGDGIADDAQEIQAAIDALTATGGTVWLLPGTYRITVSLKLRPNVTLTGTRAATIKQANAANLTQLIDFNTNSASNAGLIGITLDGNRTANTESNNTYIAFSSQAGTSVLGCAINNAPGMGLFLKGTGARVENNDFSSVFSIGIELLGPAANTAMYARIVNNTFTNIGYFAIGAVWSDFNFINGNRITGPTVVSHVTTAGTAVTWISGTNFPGLLDGMFTRIAGTEFQIQTVTSPTAMTLTTSAGVLTNQPAISGTADIINIDSCRANIITENSIVGGMSAGIMLHNLQGTVSSLENIIADNNVSSVGNMGIAAISPGAVTSVDTTIISGNIVTSCGIGATANGANTNDGIFISGNRTTNALVAGNVLRDFPTAVQQYGIYVDTTSVPAGAVQVAGNVYSGNVLGDAFGAGWTIYTVSLSSGAGAFTSAAAVGRFRLIDK